MLIRALIIVAIGFCLLLLARLLGAKRLQLAQRWPAIVLAMVAVAELSRGGVSIGLTLGALAVLAWFAGPALMAPASRKPPSSPQETQARAVLGVGPGAGEAEIRRAFRQKIAQCHPDRGGDPAEAQRLTAARDLLLKKRV